MAAENWQAKRLKLDAMIVEWQRLEDELACKARVQKISLDVACRGKMPEAQAMRALDSKIASTHRNLARRLSQIRGRRAETPAGAIAKACLGLEVQGKFDWQDNARELIEEGVAELRQFILSKAASD